MRCQVIRKGNILKEKRELSPLAIWFPVSLLDSATLTLIQNLPIERILLLINYLGGFRLVDPFFKFSRLNCSNNMFYYLHANLNIKFLWIKYQQQPQLKHKRLIFEFLILVFVGFWPGNASRRNLGTNRSSSLHGTFDRLHEHFSNRFSCYGIVNTFRWYSCVSFKFWKLFI